MMADLLPVSPEALAKFCRRWKIHELALFGSALRPDFRDESDFDLIATFVPDARWNVFDHLKMEEDLANLLGRPCDIVTREALEEDSNFLRRDRILASARTIYAA
jgi:predicted nucleotidyltransferase